MKIASKDSILALFFMYFISLLAGCAKTIPSHETGIYVPQPPLSTVKGQKYTPSVKVPATQRPYTIDGRTYYPLPSAEGFVEEGYASWYGPDFHGKPTACGETYNMYDISAAHKILPINTYVRVTNLSNGKEVIVRINDRGPFVKDRIIDLSYGAAKELGIVGPGTTRVRVEALGEGKVASSGEIKFKEHPDFKKGVFYVQVGAFLDLANARNLKRRLEPTYKDVVITTGVVGGQAFNRVQIFAANDYNEAKAFEAKITKTLTPDAFVVAR
ncbi:MAG: septal ring lytic transglycosylase RlpA family protein [Dissulfurimicrobium sp.]|uniref:septal ring lytic transglycosylase RlpA family protein n=2 Tax=Dissulfurimicrobium sp. TaxID=2022436 RepID=UPI00404A6368